MLMECGGEEYQKRGVVMASDMRKMGVSGEGAGDKS